MTFLCFFAYFFVSFFVIQIQIFFMDPREGRYFLEACHQEKQQFPDGRLRVRNMLLAEKKAIWLGQHSDKESSSLKHVLESLAFLDFFLDFQYFLDLFPRMPLANNGLGWAFDRPRQEPRDSGGPLSTIHRAIHEELGVSMEENRYSPIFSRFFWI